MSPIVNSLSLLFLSVTIEEADEELDPKNGA
jgi:hypothetical protein